MVLAAAVGKQPLLGFGSIVEIFGMLAGEQAGNVGGEAYPEVVGDDGDAAEVVVVVVEETQLFGGHVDGVVAQQG